ncbi:MAG: ACP S-malonyltransferase [Deltaproteobacteria bacterium]|nr:ACP S-malonyltransferase [Deltaproteobacteria bacterium]
MGLAGVAFIFPGQGSQAVGMAADLHEHFAEVRELFATADDVLGFQLSRIVLEGPEAELRRTANTQPAIVLASIAAYRVLGLEPAVVAGHSLGEYAAAVAAGALDFRDAIALVHRRGRYMQEAVPEGQGAMFALLGAELPAVERALASVGEGVVDIANLNAPGQIVIAGDRAAVRAAAAAAGAKAIELPVSAPFHCRLMQPAAARLLPDLCAVTFRDLRVPLYNNVDARKICSGADARDGLARQVSRTVRWHELMTRMIAAEGIHAVVEVGPGNVLTGLARRIDRNLKRFNVHDRASAAAARAALTGGAGASG